MSLIKKGDFRYDAVAQTVAQQLLKGQCVLFLGAGASIDHTQRSLPTGRQLSEALALKCRLDWHDYIPLSTIAFYFESYFTRKGLNDELLKRIDPSQGADGQDIQPIPPSTTIMRLMDVVRLVEQFQAARAARTDSKPVETLVVTTNYDRHFEQAYDKTFKKPLEVVIYRGGWNPNDRTAKLHFDRFGNPTGPFWFPSRSLTSLYKMHGCISQIREQSLVITEEDYINFLTNALGENPDNRLLWYVRSRLEISTILFIGYSLADWNFRTIFKATVERRENKEIRSYAIQLHQDPKAGEPNMLPLIVDFWHDKKVDIVNAPAEEFVADLVAAIHQEVASTNVSPASV